LHRIPGAAEPASQVQTVLAIHTDKYEFATALDIPGLQREFRSAIVGDIELLDIGDAGGDARPIVYPAVILALKRAISFAFGPNCAETVRADVQKTPEFSVKVPDEHRFASDIRHNEVAVPKKIPAKTGELPGPVKNNILFEAENVRIPVIVNVDQRSHRCHDFRKGEYTVGAPGAAAIAIAVEKDQR
jgi:hypothetical protein